MSLARYYALAATINPPVVVTSNHSYLSGLHLAEDQADYGVIQDDAVTERDGADLIIYPRETLLK